jgi:predicted PurR-regulated permease PerM
MNDCEMYAAKLAGSAMLGALTYAGTTLANLTNLAPTWLDKYGFPTMLCGILCVVIFYGAKFTISVQEALVKAKEDQARQAQDFASVLQAANNLRHEDTKHYAARLEKVVEDAAIGREKLIDISEQSLQVNQEQLAASAKSAIAMERNAEQLRNLTSAISRCTGSNG